MDSVPPVKDAIQASIELIDLCDSEDEQCDVLSSFFDPGTTAVTTTPSICERPIKRNNYSVIHNGVSNTSENDEAVVSEPVDSSIKIKHEAQSGCDIIDLTNDLEEESK